MIITWWCILEENVFGKYLHLDKVFKIQETVRMCIVIIIVCLLTVNRILKPLYDINYNQVAGKFNNLEILKCTQYTPQCNHVFKKVNNNKYWQFFSWVLPIIILLLSMYYFYTTHTQQ